MKTCVPGSIEPESKEPRLTIDLCKDVLGAKKNLECVLDTGFSGFIQVSKDIVRELELIHRGFTENEFSDKSTRSLPLYDANVLIEGCLTISGRVQADKPNCAMLIGRDFLRKARKALLVSASGVCLIDEDRVAAELSRN